MKGEGGKIKNSPLSPCGRGVGGEGDYKNGMLPTELTPWRSLLARGEIHGFPLTVKPAAGKLEKEKSHETLEISCRGLDTSG
jgi:hypothetical protein